MLFPLFLGILIFKLSDCFKWLSTSKPSQCFVLLCLPVSRWLCFLSRWKWDCFTVRGNKSLRYDQAETWWMVKEGKQCRSLLALLTVMQTSMIFSGSANKSLPRRIEKDVCCSSYSLKFKFMYWVDVSTVQLYCNA